MDIWINWIVNIAFTLMLGGVSIMVLAAILERANAYREAAASPPGFRDALIRHLESGAMDEALALCESTPGPASGVAAAGIRRYRDLVGPDDALTNGIEWHQFRRMEEKVNEAMKQQGDRELSRLEEHLTLLTTLGNIAPLMGFLGTVAGMIIAFDRIARAGMGKPQVVASGISTALWTTAAGLFIAIPAFILHNYFTKRVKGFLEEMEETASVVLHALVTDKEELVEHEMASTRGSGD